jgi:hypothetical protein
MTDRSQPVEWTDGYQTEWFDDEPNPDPGPTTLEDFRSLYIQVARGFGKTMQQISTAAGISLQQVIDALTNLASAYGQPDLTQFQSIIEAKKHRNVGPATFQSTFDKRGRRRY